MKRFTHVSLFLFMVLSGLNQNLRSQAERVLHVSDLTVQESIASFESRRRLLLENTAEHNIAGSMIADAKLDIYANRAIANLALNRFVKEANQRIRRTAEWFDHPHPNGRDHYGENDFAAMKLCQAYYLFKDTGKLEPATVQRIRRFFFTCEFKSVHPSENHHLLFHTSRFLMGLAFPDSLFQAYGKKGSELVGQDRDWLARFIRFRACRGWGEFDSPCYFQPEWECLTTLHDHSLDKTIQQLAGKMLTLLLVDMAVDSRHGMFGGAHGRIYAPHALDHGHEATYPLQYLYFGNVDPATVQEKSTLVDPLLSSYRPPEIVIDIALDREQIYENRERKHLHNVDDVMPQHPLAGSISKYTYYTPFYMMGCVQRQEAYPPECDGKWYAHHEQHEWDLSFPTRLTARLFTHHPGTSGNEHGYWTGDLRCGCSHFFQHQGVLLALYDIPPDQPYQWIHAYVPKSSFERVVEREGYIFLQEGHGVASLKMLNGYVWEIKTDQLDFKSAMTGTLGWTFTGVWRDKEIISQGPRNGAVCQVGMLAEYGSLENFMREILQDKISFDAKAMHLTCRSRRYGTLAMNTRGLREYNGQPVNLNYKTYDCPYLQSDWDSGVVHIAKGDKRLTLDFNSGEEKE